jgi:tRNA/rRNA methyltransferase
VFCFAMRRREGKAATTSRPDAALVARLHERAEALLLEVGFLQANNPDRIYDDLRAIAGRADLDAREVTILLGIIRQIEWKLSGSDSGSP